MKFLIIIGSQRSGTTALARIFSSRKRTTYLGEIFHCDPAERAKRTNYFNWASSNKDEVVASLSDFFSWENVASHVKEYFQYLVSVATDENSDLIVVDLKYPTFSFIEWPWSEAYHQPTVFNILYDEFKSCAIHIYRLNLVDQYFSRLRASTRNLWHIDFSSEVLRCNVDKYELEDYLVFTAQSIDRFSYLMRRCDHRRCFNISYEGCFMPSPHEPLSESALSLLSPLATELNINFCDLVSNVEKSGRCICEINNFEEIYDYFRGTKYEQMFQCSSVMSSLWNSLSQAKG